MVSKVRIHPKDNCHGLGIEFNYLLDDENKSADVFVTSVRDISKVYKTPGMSVWFHQCGTRLSDGGFIGYQYFELLGSYDQDYVFDFAIRLSEHLGTELEI